MPTRLNISRARSLAAAALTCRCSLTASTIWLPIVNTGLSDVIGSWKIIEISLPRSSRRSSSPSSTRSRPPKRIRLPGSILPGGSMSRMIESAVTLFPEPDSPTTPSVRPALTSRSTPSTARTSPERV